MTSNPDLLDKTAFDQAVRKAIPGLFYTLCSSTGGEESEESYNVNKNFAFPNEHHGKCGSACVSAFLQQQYAQDENTAVVLSLSSLADIHQQLRKRQFMQTPVMSCSRPIRSSTCLNWNTDISPTATKRAVLIGINYTGQAGFQLKSSHDDALRLAELLQTRYDFSKDNIALLLDDDNDNGVHQTPTKENIQDAFLQMARDSERGDFNFISFSGHGGQVRDTSGDEESGYDSSLIPSDGRVNGQILDDELLEMLVKPMKEGVITMALVDGCHSANIFDLPYTLSSTPGSKQHRKKGFDMSVVTEPVRPLTTKEKFDAQRAKRKAEKAARKEAERAAKAAEQHAQPQEPCVTTDAQGRTVVLGNPTPEQLAAIQQQMIADAQASVAVVNAGPGTNIQFQAMPVTTMSNTTALPGTHTTTTPDGYTQTVVTQIVGHR